MVDSAKDVDENRLVRMVPPRLYLAKPVDYLVLSLSLSLPFLPFGTRLLTDQRKDRLWTVTVCTGSPHSKFGSGLSGFRRFSRCLPEQITGRGRVFHTSSSDETAYDSGQAWRPGYSNSHPVWFEEEIFLI